MKPEVTVEFLSQKLAWEDVPNLEELKQSLSAGKLSKATFDHLRTPELVGWFKGLAHNVSFKTFDITPGATSSHYAQAPWWLVREKLRMKVGVYAEPTAALKALQPYFDHMALHMSVKNEGLVAFTASYSDGNNDRQTALSLSKFLGRFYPSMPDHVIAKIEADHRGELTSDDVEFYVGDDIVRIYKELENTGLGSCMTKTMQHNPIQIYAEMPEVKLAILRRGGNYKARCLVIDSQTLGKRMIRVYGDSVLWSKLSRLGYRSGGWGNVEFPVKKVPGEDDMYIMPYLDCNGGAAGNDSYTVLVDGVIKGLTASAREAYSKAFPSAVGYPSASGITRYIPLQSKDFTYVCPYTGDKYNRLEGDFKLVRYWYNSEVVNWVQKALPDTAVLLYGLETPAVYAPEGTPNFLSGGRRYIDTPKVRAAAGMVHLSPVWYPDDQDWYYARHLCELQVNGEISYIREADSVVFIAKNGAGVAQITNRHKSSVDPAWVKLHSVDKRLTYTDDPSLVVKTVSGRKVIPTVHNVVQLWDGTYEFERNAITKRIFGMWCTMPRKGFDPNTAPGFEAYLINKLKAEGYKGFMSYLRWERYINFYDRTGGYDSGSSLDLIWANWPAIEKYMANPVPALSGIHRAVGAVYRELALEKAEAEALDYSIEQEPYVQECLPGLELAATQRVWALVAEAAETAKTWQDRAIAEGASIDTLVTDYVYRIVKRGPAELTTRTHLTSILKAQVEKAVSVSKLADSESVVPEALPLPIPFDERFAAAA